MSPNLAAFLSMLGQRFGPILAAKAAAALLDLADDLQARIADAADSTDDEAAIRLWLERVDELLDFSGVLEVASDWLLGSVIEPMVLDVWSELQSGAARAQARKAIGAPVAPQERPQAVRRATAAQRARRRAMRARRLAGGPAIPWRAPMVGGGVQPADERGDGLPVDGAPDPTDDSRPADGNTL